MVASPELEPAATEMVGFLDYPIRLVIAADPEAALPPGSRALGVTTGLDDSGDASRIEVAGDGYVIRGASLIGAQHGLLRALEGLGFGFFHPFRTHVPGELAQDRRVASLDLGAGSASGSSMRSWDHLSLSFGEFLGEDPDRFIANTDLAYQVLDEMAPGASMSATIHVGADQRVEYQGEELFAPLGDEGKELAAAAVAVAGLDAVATGLDGGGSPWRREMDDGLEATAARASFIAAAYRAALATAGGDDPEPAIRRWRRPSTAAPRPSGAVTGSCTIPRPIS